MMGLRCNDAGIKGLIIESTLMKKSPLAPLYKRGELSLPFEREVRRDFDVLSF
jgi:hypothetical protein